MKAVSRASSWAVLSTAVLIAGCDSGLSEQEREDRVQAHMEALRSTPTVLASFLRELPKGGDLHNHSSGAITTEKLIQWGAEDGACVNTSTYVASNPCAAGTVPLANTKSDPALYNAVLGAWSMEGFTGSLLEAHQHFFDAFGKYGAVQLDSRSDDTFADVLSTAGRNHQLYVELLQGFGSGAGGAIAAGLFSASDPWDAPTLLARRQQIIANPDFQAALTKQATLIASTLSGTRQLLGCDTASPDPGCGVEVRLVVSANRTGTRAAVFGQWVYAYELGQLVPEVVGVNLVSPEENANSLQYYTDEMFALGTLADFNTSQAGRRKLHISLHAGELIPEVLPAMSQEQLRFHIRQAVELAHAERIGHGVDVLDETDGAGATQLLQEMHEAGVMVEICLSSNNALLGVSGARHPLDTYLAQGVPVALATDDEGILRGNISQEYLVAATTQGLKYKTLKQMARASLEHAFVEGDSLWARADDFSTRTGACQADVPGKAPTSDACVRFLTDNTRARLQWKLEYQLFLFEESVAY